ncbi:DUF4382 domain-containing protein [Haloarchaeobius sp. HME9146]|uniref:DUF4382 domain-containing protein n=1 Tax=Haloarchaeobius sp. HME9146 TaxID=2978732 RepID=UPI0021BE9444|nr:DUF4382 domain-containing protein [Haloarchaeobius sp. HME9146]MCT9095111.1 DUF4382 domain-containing protein [Haloarchaeobius sp. HME9146]
MTRSNVLAALAMAALLVTAGCMGGAVDGTQTASPNSDGTATDGSGGDATMSFYVSDRPGAIDDFEHLNVTITKVGMHRTGDVSGDDTESDANETETETNTSTTTSTSTTVEEPNETTHTMTDTMTNQSVDAKQEETETDNETETATDNETETETESESDNETETESESAEADDSESEDGWTTHQVDSKTVDLTELRGANASKLADFQVQSGDYDKVFVYVSNVEGTLKNGDKVNVKLPSGKLQINKEFTVQEGENTKFVFDIMIHKAGNSGKYVLRPVISESGTADQVEIDDVDDDSDDESAEGEDSDDESAELTAELQGQVKAGETVTLTVTNASGPVEGANVTVNGEAAGQTDADGTLSIDVPDAEDLEIEVENGDAETELERKITGNNGNGGGNGNNAIVAAVAALF